MTIPLRSAWSQIRFPRTETRTQEDYRDMCLRPDTYREGPEARLHRCQSWAVVQPHTGVSHFPRELRSWGGPAEVFRFGQNEAKRSQLFSSLSLDVG